MTSKVLRDKASGLVNSPVFPCYKGKGLCRLRTQDTDKFECVFKPEQCLYRKLREEGG